MKTSNKVVLVFVVIVGLALGIMKYYDVGIFNNRAAGVIER